jgi:hypothetical protein
MGWGPGDRIGRNLNAFKSGFIDQMRTPQGCSPSFGNTAVCSSEDGVYAVQTGILTGRSQSNSREKPQKQQTSGSACTPSVFNPSCKTPQQPTFPAVFFESALHTFNKVPSFPGGASPEDVTRAAAAAAVAQHIIDRGLVTPLRSSIVRDILFAGETIAEVVAFAPVIYSEVF